MPVVKKTVEHGTGCNSAVGISQTASPPSPLVHAFGPEFANPVPALDVRGALLANAASSNVHPEPTATRPVWGCSIFSSVRNTPAAV